MSRKLVQVVSELDKGGSCHLQHGRVAIFNQTEKSKGREKNEMLLKHGEKKRGYQRVLPFEKAFKSSEVQVREKRFSIHQSKGEKVNSRREADRGKASERDQACHLQVNGTMLNPTPTTYPLANPPISWRGFWHSGELNPAKETNESNAVRMFGTADKRVRSSVITKSFRDVSPKKERRNHEDSNVHQGQHSRSGCGYAVTGFEMLLRATGV